MPNNLKLTGPVLADMFTGKITTWNDPQIAKLNPGVNLPATKVVPIHRTDGSGDTYAFTNYLSHVDPAFKSSIGAATTVNWPGGLGAKGNSGVGGALQSTNGGIAYIAIAYVLQNKFDFALVQNAAGKYPVPGPPSIAAAAAAVKTIPAGGTAGISLVDPPASAAGAYPISTFTYVIVPEVRLELSGRRGDEEVHRLGDHDRSEGRPGCWTSPRCRRRSWRPTRRRSS